MKTNLSLVPEVDSGSKPESNGASAELVADLPFVGDSRFSEEAPEIAFSGGESRGRVPPHSLDAEQSVLGAVLIDNESIHPVLEVLRPEDFYQPSHQLIFQAMMTLGDDRKPIDVVTLTAALRDEGQLEKLGGVEYLSQLVDIVPTAANAQYYARLIKETAIRRKMIHEAGQIIEDAFSLPGGSDTFLDSVEQRVFKVSESRLSAGFVRAGEIVKDSIKQVEKLYISKAPLTGVPTGFYDLDALTYGWQPSDLIIIAGRPSMGKTALALSMARHASIEEGRAVAVFSLEMSKEQIVMRLLCSEARVSNSRVRSGKLGESDFPKMVDAASKLSQAELFIDDTGAISVLELRAKARRLHRERPLGMIVVDYLQLMRGSNRRVDRREQEISEISGALKALAKELNVPVLALSQLNRGVETRNDKRPLMADLRESGAIEQDADIIGFVYRDEVYNPDTADKGVAELIVSKHRSGPVGTIRMAFHAEYTRFDNLAQEEQYDYLGADLGGVGEEDLI